MRIGTLDAVLADTWDGLFGLAGELGFAGVELGVRADQAAGHRLWDPADRARLRAEADAAGVQICSICLHALGPLFSASDEAGRAAAVRILNDVVSFTRELGGSVVLCPLGAPAEQPYEAAFVGWVAGLRAAAPHAAAAGVTLAVESVGRTHTQSAERFERILAAGGSPAVGIYYDVGNAVYQGFDPAADLRRLGRKVAQVHVKEIGVTLMGTGGKVDFDAVFAALRAIGYDGYLILETGRGDDARASAIANRRFLEARLQ